MMKIAMGGCKPHLTHRFPKRSSFSVPTASPPPREVKIGKRWEEIQGSKNWQGLLDPLDEAVREEILRYGKFVEATYKSFDFDPSSSTYGTCIHPKHSLLHKSGLPYTGYRVTRNLHATSGIQLPCWTKAFPSWVSSKSSWIGFVAVCQDEEEITRLGRRDVVVAYRGTATCLEWLENLRTTLTEIPPDIGPPVSVNRSMVESGFLSLYTSETENCPSLRDEVKEEIGRVIQSYGHEPLSITITGHSLGAALATLTAYDITTAFHQKPPVTVMSFGGPRVGNKSFRSQVEKCGSKILRLVNSTDVITKVPGFVVNEDEEDEEEEDDIHVAGLPLPRWLYKCAENTQWVYADVGHELGLSSINSPLLPGQTNPATCHELDTYLHLVNGFESTTCPFKASAKKMLKGCRKKKRATFFRGHGETEILTASDQNQA